MGLISIEACAYPHQVTYAGDIYRSLIYDWTLCWPFSLAMRLHSSFLPLPLPFIPVFVLNLVTVSRVRSTSILNRFRALFV
jgi:hypothetical protein